jgi:hypothetical protein
LIHKDTGNYFIREGRGYLQDFEQLSAAKLGEILYEAFVG